MDNRALPCNIDPADALLPEGLAEYTASMRGFHDQIGHLNLNLLICERITAFPAHLFGYGDRGDGFLFWTRFNAYRTSCLFVTRLITDTGRNVRTVPRFSNRIISALIRPEYRRSMGIRMRPHMFDVQSDAILQKIRDYRDDEIAHLIPGPTVSGPTLGELREIATRMTACLQALSFNVDCFPLPVSYGHGPTDVDRALEALARSSSMLTMADEDPERWRVQKQRFSPEEITALNQWRSKLLGLGPV